MAQQRVAAGTDDETRGATVVEPTPAAAHPSSQQIRWSWRYQLWPALLFIGLIGVVTLLGLLGLLIHGPHAAGTVYHTRAGATETYSGTWLSSFVPLLGPGIAVMIFAPMIWYVTPHRRIRRFLRHHPWTVWPATVRPMLMVNGNPDPTTKIITLHGSDGVDHELHADIWHRVEYGWTDGEHRVHFAGRPAVRGVVVLTLGDTPSMAYATSPETERYGREALAKR